MENPGGVCGVFPPSCRARPLRSAASASQAIDHPQETILAKWAQNLGFFLGGGRGRSWKTWVACAVCFLKPEGCTHCVLLRTPRRLLTITRKRSSFSGLNTRGWGSSWKIRVACAGGGGVFWKIRRGICVVLSEIFTPIYTLFAILKEE